jgi:hypothetical protein
MASSLYLTIRDDRRSLNGLQVPQSSSDLVLKDQRYRHSEGNLGFVMKRQVRAPTNTYGTKID